MKQKIYQVDAFTDRVFSGNPAAVCPLRHWLSDELLQQIAMENNQAETAFYVQEKGRYEIRWFTPLTEVDLCGHATLAAAYVLFEQEQFTQKRIEFYSPRSGPLSVSSVQEYLVLDFPKDIFQKVPLTSALTNGFDIAPVLALRGKTDYVLIYENEEQIRNIRVALTEVAKLDGRGVVISAKGNEVDFVSRFFAPQSGIDEDPVTGSAHTTLAPYWSKILGKSTLTASQLSARGGSLTCRVLDNRVEISGKARLYMKGEIYL